MKKEFNKILKSSLKGRLSFNERLKDHSTFRIGGVPMVWFEPASSEDLARALRLFAGARIKTFIIGGGSNILAKEGLIDRAVIRLSAPFFKRLEFRNRLAVCGSGRSLSDLIKRCAQKGLFGLEGLYGIPGTVGGAIMMNAGPALDKSIGSLVEWVRVMDYAGKVFVLKKFKLKFKYRYSGLSKYIILEAGFRLKRGRPALIKKRMRDMLRKKSAALDYAFPSAGCIFKNPPSFKYTSGEILDRLGLKGLKINDAQVSAKHANFIINKKHARFVDIIALIELERIIVKRYFGIWLEPEIKIID